VYGKTPPPPELDPAFNTPCFAQCPITKASDGGGGGGGGRGGGGGGLPRWIDADGRLAGELEPSGGGGSGDDELVGDFKHCGRLPPGPKSNNSDETQ